VAEEREERNRKDKYGSSGRYHNANGENWPSNSEKEYHRRVLKKDGMDIRGTIMST
jgi:hypothetical protein